MIARHIPKLLVISVAAALAAWLTALGLLSGDSGPGFDEILKMFGPALVATLLIGFPVATLVVAFSGRQLARSVETLAITVLLVCVMLLLSAYWIAGSFGILFFGLPSVMAALTYAVLGWFLILRPMRENGNA